jgi:hypothetical protein
LCGAGQGTVVKFSEQGKKPSGSVKGGKFIECLRDRYLPFPRRTVIHEVRKRTSNDEKFNFSKQFPILNSSCVGAECFFTKFLYTVYN